MNPARELDYFWVRLIVAGVLLLTAAWFAPPGLIVWSFLIAAFFAFVFEGHAYHTGWLAVGVFLAVMLVLVPNGADGVIHPGNQGVIVTGLVCGALSGLLIGNLAAEWRKRSRSDSD